MLWRAPLCYRYARFANYNNNNSSVIYCSYCWHRRRGMLAIQRAPASSSGGGGGGGSFAGRRSSTSSSTPTALNRQILRSWADTRQGGGGVVGGGGSGGYLRGRQQRLSSASGAGGSKPLLSVIRSALGWGERPTAPDSKTASGGGTVGKEGQLAESEAPAPVVNRFASAVSPDLLTESTDSATAAAVEDVEEADMRHAEEVISSIDAEHRLIELAPEPTSAEMRLREQKLAHIAGLTVPGMTANFKDHWDARMLGKGMRANHLMLCYFTVINPGSLAICKWQGKMIAIRSGEAMNRALDRDQVAVHLLPIRQWTLGLSGPTVESELKRRPNFLAEIVPDPVDIDSPFMSHEQINLLCQAGLVMTGEVVRIVSSFNNKCFVGSLSMHRSGRAALFKPRDRRVPLMLVPVHPLFMGLEVKRQLQKNVDMGLAGEAYTVAVKMVDWPSHLLRPVAEVLPLNTDVATIEGATQAILVETGIEERPFPPAALEDVAKTFYITKQDRKDREDFTDRCVVSIDPATARDLDDALHVKSHGNGCYEVGVHIADVSHFVPSESALDREARRRSTSVYLVQRVIPMLPEALSNGYCSLHPGEEKLAFSVIFQIGLKGDVQSYRFAKSIIKSCCRLSYEEAEQMLNSDEFLPSEVSSPFSGRQVRTTLRQLHQLAKKFRKERLSKAALGFSVANKLQFTCPDGVNGVPQLMKEEDAEWSHQLVEEWMLKANVAAAETLVKEAPDVALLRRHPPPRDPRGLAETLVSLARVVVESAEDGAENSGNGSKAARSILQAAAGSPGNNNLAASSTEIMLKLNDFLAEQSDDPQFRSFAATLAIMQMSLAEYICTGYHPDRDSWRHFALKFPVYTHFTSPIRRYADLLVHRQLVGALSLSSPTTQQQQQQQQQQQRADQVEAQAMWCNRWRISAKRASERSSQLFYAAFLRATGPSEGFAFAKSVGRLGMEVMIPQLLFTTRLDYQRLQSQCPGLVVRRRQKACNLVFPPAGSCPHRLTLKLNFRSEVPVYLEASEDNLLQINLRIRRPECPKCAANQQDSQETAGSAPHSLSVVADSDESELEEISDTDEESGSASSNNDSGASASSHSEPDCASNSNAESTTAVAASAAAAASAAKAAAEAKRLAKRAESAARQAASAAKAAEAAAAAINSRKVSRK
ncbi:hypothetical protein BOX15_Mlig034482g1 [Macrostomum lignano]|uniref:RNB domain-containing protein n=1 Tax=Macrostomum lignano TaxID=282301 RepID=A0A267EX64_9PLAT|nr:hypothetical protein BOX15_Mlig034482g1 [Macrostomum lignano]